MELKALTTFCLIFALLTAIATATPNTTTDTGPNCGPENTPAWAACALAYYQNQNDTLYNCTGPPPRPNFPNTTAVVLRYDDLDMLDPGMQQYLEALPNIPATSTATTPTA
jgi:hypothetical protein